MERRFMAEKRELQMKEITEQLEQGVKELFTSEMYTEYLRTMSQAADQRVSAPAKACAEARGKAAA